MKLAKLKPSPLDSSLNKYYAAATTASKWAQTHNKSEISCSNKAHIPSKFPFVQINPNHCPMMILYSYILGEGHQSLPPTIYLYHLHAHIHMGHIQATKLRSSYLQPRIQVVISSNLKGNIISITPRSLFPYY